MRAWNVFEYPSAGVGDVISLFLHCSFTIDQDNSFVESWYGMVVNSIFFYARFCQVYLGSIFVDVHILNLLQILCCLLVNMFGNVFDEWSSVFYLAMSLSESTA